MAISRDEFNDAMGKADALLHAAQDGLKQLVRSAVDNAIDRVDVDQLTERMRDTGNKFFDDLAELRHKLAKALL